MLRWRQEHLPLDQLHRHQDRQALSYLEQKAAWWIADQLRLDDDQRYSLIRNHADQVEQRVARVRPALADLARAPARPPRRHAFLNVMAGWGA